MSRFGWLQRLHRRRGGDAEHAGERVAKLNEALRAAGYEIRPEGGADVAMAAGGRFRTTLGIHDLGTGNRLALAGSEGDILWFLAEHCGFGRIGRKLGLKGEPAAGSCECPTWCACDRDDCPNCRSKRMNAADRERVKQSLERAIRTGFPTDTVDITDGYRDNIHIVVTSRRFDNMPEQNRLDWLWGLIGESGLSEEEKDLISLVVAWSVNEILAGWGGEAARA